MADPITLTQGQSYMGGTVGFDSATGKPLAPGATTLSSPAPTVSGSSAANYNSSTIAPALASVQQSMATAKSEAQKAAANPLPPSSSGRTAQQMDAANGGADAGYNYDSAGNRTGTKAPATNPNDLSSMLDALEPNHVWAYNPSDGSKSQISLLRADGSAMSVDQAIAQHPGLQAAPLNSTQTVASHQGMSASPIPLDNNTTVAKLNDGTYASLDAAGNFLKSISADEYNAAVNGSASYLGTLRDNASNQFQSDYKGQLNGSVPLEQWQQDQIKNIQNQYADLIAKQTLANANYEGGTKTLQGLLGMSEYSPGNAQGAIKAAVDEGMTKIGSLNSELAAAVGKMTSAFRTDNMTALKTAYDEYQSNVDKRQAQIDKVEAAVALAANEQKNRDATVAAAKLAEDNKKEDAKIVQQGKADDDIRTAILDARKGGASPEQLSAMEKSLENHDYANAIAAGGDSLSDPTTPAGMYRDYVKRAQKSGVTPMSPEAFQVKVKGDEAYAAKAGSNAADTAAGKSNAGQQKLEQEYRMTIEREFSNRNAGLGLQGAKVDQAIHLKALFDQYKTVDSSGNTTYNIPQVQYVELAVGLANLVAPTGQVSDSARDAIMQKTAKGDLMGALSYATGEPMNGSTQAVYKNLVDSIDRQGGVAEDLRDTYVKRLEGLAPTDLDPKRVDALTKDALPSFRNSSASPADKIVADQKQTETSVINYAAQHPENVNLDSALKQISTGNFKDGKPFTIEDVKTYFNIP